MNKVKIDLNHYKEVIIILLTVFQLGIMFYYFNFRNDNNTMEEVEYVVATKVTFNEVFNSLNNIANLEILEIEDLDNEWYAKVSITGEEEKIIKAVNELEKFKMYNYDIVGKKGILSVIIELYR